MGKHKPLSILKRSPGQQKKRPARQSTEQNSPQKRQKIAPAIEGRATPSSHSTHPAALGPASKRIKAPARKVSAPTNVRPGTWEAVSVVDRQAARAVQQLLKADASGKGGASIKSLTLAPSIEAKKATHAVTCQTLKLLPVLKQLLDSCTLLQQHPELQQETAYVLVYEVLFGEGLRRRGPAEKAVMSAKEDLKRLLDDMKTQAAEDLERLQRKIKAEAGVEDVEALLSSDVQRVHEQQRPRTARVNTLKMSVAKALAWLSSPPPEHSSHAHEAVSVDELLPDVLHFPPGTDLHDHPLVHSTCLIQQSKSSCMPAHALKPEPDWEVLDACAAPGNKTTHVAALMGGKGRVLAFDRDAKRLARLKANAKAAGASTIEAQVADFLSLPLATDDKFRNVKGALVDPSCSGSGTVHSRMDHLLPSFAHRQTPNSPVPTPQAGRNGSVQAASSFAGSSSVSETDRIERLATFQEAAVKHALTLPALQRLVYSTCSVHERENEAVVAAVLVEAKKVGFRLVDPFPEWHRRGNPGSVDGIEQLVRVDPFEDETDGFFIAVFERS